MLQQNVMRKNMLNFQQLKAGKHAKSFNYSTYFRWLSSNWYLSTHQLLQNYFNELVGFFFTSYSNNIPTTYLIVISYVEMKTILLAALGHFPKVKIKQKETKSYKWFVRYFSTRLLFCWHNWQQKINGRSSSVWWYVWQGEKYWYKGRQHNHEVDCHLLWMHSLFEILIPVNVTTGIWWYGLMDLVIQCRKSWFKTPTERQNCIKLFSKRSTWS